jgi:hypothetical protein
VRQYFKRESADPLLNQMDSPNFTWRTKNFLWDGLNVLKSRSLANNKKSPMITDSNHAYYNKMLRR